jgi:hypothetical protein
MRQPSARAAAMIALSQYEKPLVILIRHVKASFPERACVGVRLANPTPRGQYWLFLLLFVAIDQPAVAGSAQKSWIWVMSSLPETAAMLAVIRCSSVDLPPLPDLQVSLLSEQEIITLMPEKQP